MAKYMIDVTETLKRTVVVEAETFDEAVNKADFHVTLDYDDYTGRLITAAPHENSPLPKDMPEDVLEKYEYIK